MNRLQIGPAKVAPKTLRPALVLIAVWPGSPTHTAADIDGVYPTVHELSFSSVLPRWSVPVLAAASRLPLSANFECAGTSSSDSVTLHASWALRSEFWASSAFSGWEAPCL